jgi:threonine synthase
MKEMYYTSTNNPDERVNFETALLRGMASNYGLYVVPRDGVPTLTLDALKAMRTMTYAEIALEVLRPYLSAEIPERDLKPLLADAYREQRIPTDIQHVTGESFIMWLTKGPTYSFKDYAARFFARALDYFLGKKGVRRLVVVATSGDTGGAVADALHGLDNVDNVVFFPKGSISEGQRRLPDAGKKPARGPGFCPRGVW